MVLSSRTVTEGHVRILQYEYQSEGERYNLNEE